MSDFEKGPEWTEMEERFKRENVTDFHFDRIPGVTDEEVAGEINRIFKHLDCEYNKTVALLTTIVSDMKKYRNSILNSHGLDVNSGTWTKIEPSKTDEIEARSIQIDIETIEKAIALLERHGDKTHCLKTESGEKVKTTTDDNEIIPLEDSDREYFASVYNEKSPKYAQEILEGKHDTTTLAQGFAKYRIFLSSRYAR